MRWKSITNLIQLTRSCRMLTAVMLALFASAAAPGQTDLPSEVGDLFGLASGQLIMLDLDGVTERRGQVEAKIDGCDRILSERVVSSFVYRLPTVCLSNGSRMSSVP
jgi:hypothetical protein